MSAGRRGRREPIRGPSRDAAQVDRVLRGGGSRGCWPDRERSREIRPPVRNHEMGTSSSSAFHLRMAFERTRCSSGKEQRPVLTPYWSSLRAVYSLPTRRCPPRRPAGRRGGPQPPQRPPAARLSLTPREYPGRSSSARWFAAAHRGLHLGREAARSREGRRNVLEAPPTPPSLPTVRGNRKSAPRLGRATRSAAAAGSCGGCRHRPRSSSACRRPHEQERDRGQARAGTCNRPSGRVPRRPRKSHAVATPPLPPRRARTRRLQVPARAWPAISFPVRAACRHALEERGRCLQPPHDPAAAADLVARPNRGADLRFPRTVGRDGGLVAAF